MPSCNAAHVAIELSRSTWLIAARLLGTERSRPRFEDVDGTALLAFLGEIRRQVSIRLGHAVDLACCFEAGRDGFGPQCLLAAPGITAHVPEPPGELGYLR